MCQGNWIRSYKSYGRENHGLFQVILEDFMELVNLSRILRKGQNLSSRNQREPEERQMKQQEKHPRAVDRGNLKIWLVGRPLVVEPQPLGLFRANIF